MAINHPTSTPASGDPDPGCFNPACAQTRQECARLQRAEQEREREEQITRAIRPQTIAMRFFFYLAAGLALTSVALIWIDRSAMAVVVPFTVAAAGIGMAVAKYRYDKRRDLRSWGTQ